MGENYVQKSPMSKVVDTPTLKINFRAEDLRRNKKMVLRATFFSLLLVTSAAKVYGFVKQEVEFQGFLTFPCGAFI